MSSTTTTRRPHNAIQHDATMATICRLQTLEDSFYYKYLKSVPASSTTKTKSTSKTILNKTKNKDEKDVSDEVSLQENFRKNMTRWYFEVANHWNVRHETIAAAIICLDRFFALCPKDVYNNMEERLAAMTVLFTVVKTHERKPIKLRQLVTLSGDEYTEQQFADFEYVVLETLQWRVSPPTPMEFVRLLLQEGNGIISSMTIPDFDDRLLMIEVAMTQVQLALCDDYFVRIKPSIIAYCSLLNAIPAVIIDGTDDALHNIQTDLLIILGLDNQSMSQRRKMKKVQNRLYKLVAGMMVQLNQSRNKHNHQQKQQKQQKSSDDSTTTTPSIDSVTTTKTASTILSKEESPRSIRSTR